VSTVPPGPTGAHPWDDEHHDEDEEAPHLHVSRRTLVGIGVGIVALVALVVVVLPQVNGLRSTYDRISDGDPWWLALATFFSALSFGGYVAMFKRVYVRADDPSAKRIGFAESYQITMAGLAATRLFAAGGAGGLALTAWALRRSGMPARVVADRTIAFLVLTYLVYVIAVILGGFGLHFGILEGEAPFALTVVPAAIGLVLLAAAVALTYVPEDLERRFARWAAGGGRVQRLLARLSTAPAAASEGIRMAFGHLRRRDPALLGAIAYWGFNIAILWACFHAFGEPPPPAVLVVAYFVGLLGNLLPLPGGIGGVDGGMIGALVGFGVSASLAVVAVLSYRVLAFWLPTLPGAVAYLQLRRTVTRWRQERAVERRQDGVTTLNEVPTKTPTRSAS
jgi:uncharacterized protein (TIRG00374 family)